MFFYFHGAQLCPGLMWLKKTKNVLFAPGLSDTRKMISCVDLIPGGRNVQKKNILCCLKNRPPGIRKTSNKKKHICQARKVLRQSKRDEKVLNLRPVWICFCRKSDVWFVWQQKPNFRCFQKMREIDCNQVLNPDSKNSCGDQSRMVSSHSCWQHAGQNSGATSSSCTVYVCHHDRFRLSKNTS